LRVAAQRCTEAFDELVFDSAATPGAVYALQQRRSNAWEERATFRGHISSSPTDRRLDLWSLLPRYPRRVDESGDLRAFIACLQDIVDLLVLRIEAMPGAFDLERASEKDLAQVLADQGNPFSFALDAGEARRLSSVLIEVYRQKGTARGIANAIRLFLGIEVEEMRCHIVTKDDDGIIVGGASPASLYAFDVAFAHPLTEEQSKRVRAIAEYLKPAHTHLVDVLPLP
jgi:phage tail-like protein